MAATQAQIDRQSIVLAGCVAILNGTASASLLVRFAADLLRAGTLSTAEAIRRAAASALMSQIFAGTADAAYMARYGESVQLALDILNLNINVDEDGNYSVPWEENFNLPEQDVNGWSILTPSATSRIIYVDDQNGNDGTAAYYVYGDDDEDVGSDVFNPAGTVTAYASISAAYSQSRAGEDDFILLRRGGEWESGTFATRAGGSTSARSYYGAYGSGERPIVRTGTATGVTLANYSAVVGINFIAHDRNPDDGVNFVGFSSVGNNPGFSILANNRTGVIVEGCWFDWYKENIIMSFNQNHSSSPTDIIVRRNIITNCYSHDERSSGIFSWFSSVLLEENIFDHNGWYQQQITPGASNEDDGQATQYNHNTYFAESFNTIFRKNIFLRGSSMGNKFTSNTSSGTNQIMSWNVLCDNNFYAEGEIAISMGGNDDQGNGPRWENILLVNNVALHLGRTQPTNRTFGWGWDIDDWDGGAIVGNILAHQGESYLGLSRGLTASGHTTNVSYTDNIFYDIYTGNNFAVVTLSGSTHTGVVFARNQIQNPNGGAISLLDVSDKDGETFSDSLYYSDGETDVFRIGGIGSDLIALATLNSYLGDTTSTMQQIAYVAPSRNLASYAETFLGITLATGGTTAENNLADMNAVVAELVKQKIGDWDSARTAVAINDYIRAGFQEAA